MVFAREINGQELTFGVSGMLIMNAVVFYDHQTDTLWSQFKAEAVQGPLKGTKVELLLVQLTTWQTWIEQHPDTLVLYTDGEAAYDPYSSYYFSPSPGILGEANRDPRLRTKSLVLGLDNGRIQRAYALVALSEQLVLNDEFDGQPIVVAADPLTLFTAAVFLRQAGDETLTFEMVDERGEGEVLLRDQETGSIWSGATGKAMSGPLAGEQLEQLPSFIAFWFAWSDFFPDTELYPPGGLGG